MGTYAWDEPQQLPRPAMENRTLNADELKHANELLKEIRRRLIAAGDPLLQFAYRRKIIKELGYD
jgi:hypothetical protein